MNKLLSKKKEELRQVQRRRKLTTWANQCLSTTEQSFFKTRNMSLEIERTSFDIARPSDIKIRDEAQFISKMKNIYMTNRNLQAALVIQRFWRHRRHFKYNKHVTKSMIAKIILIQRSVRKFL